MAYWCCYFWTIWRGGPKWHIWALFSSHHCSSPLHVAREGQGDTLHRFCLEAYTCIWAFLPTDGWTHRSVLIALSALQEYATDCSDVFHWRPIVFPVTSCYSPVSQALKSSIGVVCLRAPPPPPKSASCLDGLLSVYLLIFHFGQVKVFFYEMSALWLITEPLSVKFTVWNISCPGENLLILSLRAVANRARRESF